VGSTSNSNSNTIVIRDPLSLTESESLIQSNNLIISFTLQQSAAVLNSQSVILGSWLEDTSFVVSSSFYQSVILSISSIIKRTEQPFPNTASLEAGSTNNYLSSPDFVESVNLRSSSSDDTIIVQDSFSLRKSESLIQSNNVIISLTVDQSGTVSASKIFIATNHQITTNAIHFSSEVHPSLQLSGTIFLLPTSLFSAREIGIPTVFLPRSGLLFISSIVKQTGRISSTSIQSGSSAFSESFYFTANLNYGTTLITDLWIGFVSMTSNTEIHEGSTTVNTGTLIAGVIGGLVFVGVIAGLIIFFVKRRHARTSTVGFDGEMDVGPGDEDLDTQDALNGQFDPSLFGSNEFELRFDEGMLVDDD
jgi:hypothetical protein